MHLFSGPPGPELLEPEPGDERATLAVRSEDERIRRLEEEVEKLAGELSEMSRRFEEFKAQFE